MANDEEESDLTNSSYDHSSPTIHRPTSSERSATVVKPLTLVQEIKHLAKAGGNGLASNSPLLVELRPSKRKATIRFDLYTISFNFFELFFGSLIFLFIVQQSCHSNLARLFHELKSA